MSHDPVRAFAPLAAGMVAALDVSGLWVPVLGATTTNPNLGSGGSTAGSWHVSGHWVTIWGQIHFSGTGISGGSGRWQISTPFPCDPSFVDVTATGADGSIVGVARLRDNSDGSNSQNAVMQFDTGSTLWMMSHATNTGVTSGSPFTPAADDRIAFTAAYPIDPASLPVGGTT